MITREALNPASRQNGVIPHETGVLSLAQGKRQQAKELKRKWKGIQVNFLEELTLFETCLDVSDF